MATLIGTSLKAWVVNQFILILSRHDSSEDSPLSTFSLAFEVILPVTAVFRYCWFSIIWQSRVLGIESENSIQSCINFSPQRRRLTGGQGIKQSKKQTPVCSWRKVYLTFGIDEIIALFLYKYIDLSLLRPFSMHHRWYLSDFRRFLGKNIWTIVQTDQLAKWARHYSLYYSLYKQTQLCEAVARYLSSSPDTDHITQLNCPDRTQILVIGKLWGDREFANIYLFTIFRTIFSTINSQPTQTSPRHWELAVI